MTYVILDPVDPYAGAMMEFLGRAGHRGLAVFSNRKQWLKWRHRWSWKWGRLVDDAYLVPAAPGLGALARRMRAEWPEIDGIIPWDERSVLLGAALGECLELDWNPYRVIERCRDKAVMKAWLRQVGGVRVNASRTVRSADEALEFQESLGTWPIVVKPSGGAGSIEVSFADDSGELLGACQRVMESGMGDVLVEEFVGGTEYAVNGVVDTDGDLLVTDVWVYDRRDVPGARNVYFQAAKVDRGHPVFDRLGAYAARVVEAMQLRRSPIHMEAKVDRKGPCLIEIGARLAGGNLPMLASKLHGRSLFELAACHYLAHLPLHPGEVDYERYDRWEARVVEGVQPRTLPRIHRVHGVERVEALPSFHGWGLLRPPGTPAPRTVDLDTNAWELYLIHEDLGQIDRDARLARKLLRYE